MTLRRLLRTRSLDDILQAAERPQFDRMFSVPEFRQPLVVALAALAEDVEVVTEIRFRRAA